MGPYWGWGAGQACSCGLWKVFPALKTRQAVCVPHVGKEQERHKIGHVVIIPMLQPLSLRIPSVTQKRTENPNLTLGYAGLRRSPALPTF